MANVNNTQIKLETIEITATAHPLRVTVLPENIDTVIDALKWLDGFKLEVNNNRIKNIFLKDKE